MKIQEHFSLKNYNTFGIAAEAEKVVEIHGVTDIQGYLADEELVSLPRLILGGGSNVLLLGNVQGVVLMNRILGIEVVREDETQIELRVGAGEVWHDFVMYCIDHDYAGIENLSLIPGMVGASPMQNIGAYGVEVKDVITQVEAVELSTGKEVRFRNEECAFDYRSSIFKTTHKDQYLITHVSFLLNKVPEFNTSYGAIEGELKRMGVKELSIRAVSEAVCNIRRSKLPDPEEIGNAGSFFKNPVLVRSFVEGLRSKYPEMPFYEVSASELKVPAAWLIQECGWKGKQFGNYGVHDKQPLVLVNLSDANGSDIFALSEEIIQSVESRFGIRLEREVNIIG